MSTSVWQAAMYSFKVGVKVLFLLREMANLKCERLIDYSVIGAKNFQQCRNRSQTVSEWQAQFCRSVFQWQKIPWS